MNIDLLTAMNFFGIFLVFTVAGVFLGYLVGYIWARLDRRSVLSTVGLNVNKNPRPNHYVQTTNSQEAHDGGPIKFHSMPVGYHPWRQTKEYAKGA